MHYSNLVIVERVVDPDALKEAVDRAMGPNEDNGGFWDWYQIGGRWTGLFDGYEPEEDPANRERCPFCAGTGKRIDIPELDKCNACDGMGIRLKWPTQWASHPGDIVPIEAVTQEAFTQIFRVVCPSGIFPSERYEPWANEKFPKQDLPPLAYLKEQFSGHFAVIVDNHS